MKGSDWSNFEVQKQGKFLLELGKNFPPKTYPVGINRSYYFIIERNKKSKGGVFLPFFKTENVKDHQNNV